LTIFNYKKLIKAPQEEDFTKRTPQGKTGYFGTRNLDSGIKKAKITKKNHLKKI